MKNKTFAKEQSKILIVSISLMIVVSTIVETTSLWFLYRSMLSQQIENLQAMVEGQAKIIESLDSSDDSNNTHYPSKSEIDNPNFIHAYSNQSWFGETGEFVLGKRNADNITFLSKFRFPNQIRAIPFDSTLAEPMRNALENRKGWLIGQDYRGMEVLAAYYPLNNKQLGLVAKLDIQEINKPFIETAIYTLFIAGVTIALGALLIIKFSKPLIQHIKANHESFQNLLESAPDGMLIVNSAGDIVLVNEKIESLFGYLRHEIIGSSIEKLLPTSSRNNHAKLIESYFQNPSKRAMGSNNSNLHGLQKNGIQFPCEISLSPVETMDGEMAAASIRDITDRKNVEAQVMQSQKMEAMGKLTGGVAHDYNNMLGVIMGYSSILEAELQDHPTLADYAHQIHYAGERGANLTKKLLSFSKKQATNLSIVDINSLLAEQSDMLRKSLTVSIALEIDLSDEPCFVKVDVSELEDAILNLCINAMHAVSDRTPDPKLTIRTTNQVLGTRDAISIGLEPGEYVQLSIIDNGTGMDDKTKDRIFEPFYSTKKHGTGLGLSQVFGLVKRSGGNISVISKVDYGTYIALYFPRYINPADRDLPKKDIAHSPYGYAKGLETILLVDDEKALLELLSILISKHGYKVFSADSGKKALEICKKESINLILSDIIMPEMDGFQLASIIQKEYPSIKIQLGSGYSDSPNKVTADTELSKNILHKPYNYKELFLRLRELLDS